MNRKNAFLQLREDTEHLQMRFLQLYTFGRKREAKLEHTVANVWHYLCLIQEGKEVATASEICEKLIPFLRSALKEDNCSTDGGDRNAPR